MKNNQNISYTRLSKNHLKTLKAMIFFPSSIFWLRGSDKMIALFKVGDLVTQESLNKIERIINKSVHTVLFVRADQSHFSNHKGINFFIKLKNLLGEVQEGEKSRSEQQRAEGREILLKYFWDNYKDFKSLQDICLLNNSSLKHISRFKSKDLKILCSFPDFSKACLCGVYNLMTGLSLGYLSYQFLQDLFHLPFFYLKGLSQCQHSHILYQALEKEQFELGTGLTFLLEKGVNNKTVNEFKNRYRLSRDYTLANYSNFFHQPMILNYILKLNQSDFAYGDDLGSVLAKVYQCLSWKEISENEIQSFSFSSLVLNLASYDHHGTKRVNEVFQSIDKSIENVESEAFKQISLDEVKYA